MLNLQQSIENVIGQPVADLQALSGGMVGAVYRARLADDTLLVVKTAGEAEGYLSVEGYMLRYLAEHSNLPVPQVCHSSDTLLIMTFIEGDSRFDRAAERHAAGLLTELHAITNDTFGLERDTLIGPLHQPNPPTASWLDFFRERRLLYMGRIAAQAGRLPQSIDTRLQTFAGHLDRWLPDSKTPSLIHGDIWATNVLAHNGRITAFLDPAIYYAHAEMELAYITLFNTFGAAFFEHYHQLRPIEAGFFEERRDIYNLYPLLVHVRLFGGGYAGSVDRILRRFGF